MKSTSTFFSYWMFFLLTGMLVMPGCGERIKSSDKDTPTTGKIKVGLDDSYSLMIQAEMSTFHYFYNYATIDTLCRSEADVIDAFMRDSIKMMVVSRKLTEDEETRLKNVQIYPKTTLIAYDAIAFIVNNENPDTSFFYDKIKDLFTGKIKSWKEINPNSRLGDLKIVFDNYKSGNTRFFREKFQLNKLPDICFALNKNSDVIDFVERNKGAIGVISVNWVSNKEDTVSHTFLKKVKVVSVSPPGMNDKDGNFYTPHPYYIAENFYPFTREVFCINRQIYNGLAYGFSSFIAGEKGQMIILHEGMVPATMPVRFVEIKH